MIGIITHKKGINQAAILAANAIISAANVSTVSETQATQNATIREQIASRRIITKLPVPPMRPFDAKEIRYAVNAYVRYAPNCHQEDIVPREDLRSAFAYLRRHINRGDNYLQAAGQLEDLARSYRNM